MAGSLPATTSPRQGRLREEGSEGSRRQDPRADEQKRHPRPSSSGEPAPEGEAHGSEGMVNGAVVRGQLTLLSGEICLPRGAEATGDGLRPISKGVEKPPVPTAPSSARRAETPGARRQKSAEAIVAARRPDRRAAKGRTSWNKEEP
jgi:hypothetical protein